MSAGGLPVRGDLLPLWLPAGPPDDETRRAWEPVAYRVALGVELVAHLEPIVDAERLQTGFCVRSAELARIMADAVLSENVGACTGRAHPAMHQEEACDVILACHPGAPDEQVNHAVLAATKAAHAFFCAPR